MNSDSFKPESEVEEPETAIVQADDGDPWAAVKRNALAEDDGLADSVDEDEPEVPESQEEAAADADVSDAPEVQADKDESISDEPAKEETAAWDRNPETLPETLKPVYQEMERYFHEQNRIRAEEKRQDAAKRAELDALLAEARARDTQTRGVQPGQAAGNQQVGPPPMPTAEDDDATATQKWDARQKWFAQEVLREATEKGEVITRDQFNHVEEDFKIQRRKQLVTSQDGFTPEVGDRMVELAQADQRHAMKLLDDRMILDLFDIAKRDVELAKAQQLVAQRESARAEQEAESIREKSAAGRKAVSRPGGVPTPTKINKIPAGATAEERLEIARQAALGGSA